MSGAFHWLLFLSPGNTKKAIYILQKAFELGAEPKEMLETTLQSMQAGKMNLSCLEDKENAPCEFVCLFCCDEDNKTGS